MIDHEVLQRIARFSKKIGLECRPVEKVENCFLPGIEIIEGVIRFSPGEMRLASDLLHEVAHVAIIPKIFRSFIDTDAVAASSDIFDALHLRAPEILENPDHPLPRALIQAGEAEALAWQWAAGVEIGLSPEQIFPPGSVTDEGHEEIRDRMAAASHFGVHGLHHAGLCVRRNWPIMTKWVQDATHPDLDVSAVFPPTSVPEEVMEIDCAP